MLGILRKPKRPELDADTLQLVFEVVRNAPSPVNGQRINREVNLDGNTLQNYLDELVSKGCIESPYDKLGMDGIPRQFYRVTEKHSLKEVKDQIGAFMKKLQKRLKPFVEDGSLYAVKVYGHKELNMVFNQRPDAREYKQLLAKTKMRLKSDIFYQKFEDGLQTEEKKVS